MLIREKWPRIPPRRTGSAARGRRGWTTVYRSRVRGFLEVHGWRSIEQEGNGGGSGKGRTSGAGRLGCRKEGREEPGEEERAAGAGEVGPARHFSDAGAMR